MHYPVLAPTDAVSPVVTASVCAGDPIPAKPAKVPGWTFLTLKLRPFDEFSSPNYALIVTKFEPKQTGDVDGSQGGYLKDIRARTHSWLLAGGDFELAQRRLAEYKAVEAQVTLPGKEWGPPRRPGRRQTQPPVIASPKQGVRGPDKHPRRQRRDEYIIYTSPQGESLPILARSRLGQDLLTSGTFVPEGWACSRGRMGGSLDRRPLLAKLAGMKADGRREAMALDSLRDFLKGVNPMARRQPVPYQPAA
jgi:hypothetical protein